MEIERMKIADLKPAEKNTRVHTAKQLEELYRSYKMFGQIRPVIIDESNVIWCGNGFYESMKNAGETEIDVLRMVGLSEDKKRKLMLADNQIFTLGASNTAVLDEFLSELEDFDVPGYDSDTLQQLYGDIEDAMEDMASYGVIDDEAIEVIEKAEEIRNEVKEERVYTSNEKPADTTELPPTIKATDGMVNIPTDKETRPFIVCPRCGEKIWV